MSTIPKSTPIGDSRLALGAVQFGMSYGVANQSGQVPADEVGRILVRARAHGVDTLDTAMGYGCSEACLGEQGVAAFKVVTKLSALPDDVRDVQAWVDANVAASLERLGVVSLYGLLLHRPVQLTGPRGVELAQALLQQKTRGLVSKIGVSIYTPSELEAACKACLIELVQAPFSLVDRRFYTSGWMDRLHAMGVEIHVRSVFLQGLLLMPRMTIPEKFSRTWPAVWDAWHGWLAAHPDVTAAQACLGFVQGYPQIDRIVMGVDSLTQFDQLITAASAGLSIEAPALGSDDEVLVNPSKWNGI